MVETFEKEVIVYRLGCLTIGNLLANGILRVCHREIPERYIRGGYIEIAIEVTLNLLETFNTGQN